VTKTDLAQDHAEQDIVQLLKLRERNLKTANRLLWLLLVITNLVYLPVGRWWILALDRVAIFAVLLVFIAFLIKVFLRDGASMLVLAVGSATVLIASSYFFYWVIEREDLFRFFLGKLE